MSTGFFFCKYCQQHKIIAQRERLQQCKTCAAKIKDRMKRIVNKS